MTDASRDEERLLVLTPSGRDATLATGALAVAGLISHVCATAAELCEAIEAGAGAAIVASEALGPGTIDDIRAVLDRQPAWSDFPLIVLTPHAESAESNRRRLAVLARLGNVTTLERPVHALGMTGAAHAALRARRRQYEARDLLAQLEETIRQREHFLAMLGHELRNPVNAIRNAVQLANLAPHDASSRERGIAIVERQSRLLIRLVDDLLEVSRITSGKIALQREHVDLDAIARQVVETHAPTFAAAQLELRFEQTGPRVTVDADRARLEQILTNLLMNAAKYTPAGGRVVLRVARTDGSAVVEVMDNGVGISPADLPRIFELFAQADESLERSRGGLGIGLTLARSLANLHGGSLDARSDGPGRGSVFTLRLPAVERHATTAAVAADPEPTPMRTILLVEDNRDNRESLRELLELQGHVVHVAADGVEGLRRAIELRPEVALLDIGLPSLSGYDLAGRIRAALGDSIALVALTGYGQPEHRRRALASGFDAHITKPIDIADLQRLLARVRGGAVQSRLG